MPEARSGLVPFSGGQHATRRVAWALQPFESVETIAFDDRRRPRIELDQQLVAITRVRRRFPAWPARPGEDHLIAVPGRIGDASPTRETACEIEQDGLADTFVPGRNYALRTRGIGMGRRDAA